MTLTEMTTRKGATDATGDSELMTEKHCRMATTK